MLALTGFFLLFGVLLGTVFGFFAMGGSFLITPLLIIIGYPAQEAVATGLAFVFGTSIISMLKHREYNQTDYKLGLLMGAAMSFGVFIGSKVLSYFEQLGNSDLFVGGAYIVLLGVVGIEMMRGSRTDHTELEQLLARHRLYPVIRVGKKNRKISVWIITLLGFLTGIVAGLMGVGGGFLLVPVMTLFLGLNASVAVGTTILVILLSSGYGTFLYAGQGLVNLEAVTTLLFGSALGAKLGAKASNIVPEEDLENYFGYMVLLGALAVSIEQIRSYTGLGMLRYISIAVIFGSTVLMSTIIYIDAFRTTESS